MAKGFASSQDAVKQRPAQQPLPPALDTESVQVQWQLQFAELEDPRGLQGVEHPFLSIVMIAILAVIGGATGWEDIETYAESLSTGTKNETSIWQAFQPMFIAPRH